MFLNFRKKNKEHSIKAPFTGGIIAHDNRSVFSGVCTDISVWGLSFSAEAKSFSAGSEVIIHLKPGEGLSAFNAVCELVSVSEAAESASLIQYTARFISMKPEVMEEIDNFIKLHEVKDAI
ncbi:MAG TPA: PilZ domain-containing protein [Bdellovibrio sp.]